MVDLKTVFRRMITAILLLASGIIAPTALADSCTSAECTNTIINRVMVSETGNVYVGVSADINSLSCIPHQGGDQSYLIVPDDGSTTRDAFYALVQILHQRARSVAKIKVATSGSCTIEELHSEF